MWHLALQPKLSRPLLFWYGQQTKSWELVHFPISFCLLVWLTLRTASLSYLGLAWGPLSLSSNIQLLIAALSDCEYSQTQTALLNIWILTFRKEHLFSYFNYLTLKNKRNQIPVCWPLTIPLVDIKKDKPFIPIEKSFSYYFIFENLLTSLARLTTPFNYNIYTLMIPMLREVSVPLLTYFSRPETDSKLNGSWLWLGHLLVGDDIIDKYCIALDSRV